MRGKGTFIIEKMEDHFLALQTYGYHDNAVPSEVLLTTFCSLYTVLLSDLVNGTANGKKTPQVRRWTLTSTPTY